MSISVQHTRKHYPKNCSKLTSKILEKSILVEREKDILIQLKRLLVLVIDEMSQLNSSLLAGAEQNIRQCIYNGSSAKEYWGGLTVVLLFGDD